MCDRSTEHCLLLALQLREQGHEPRMMLFLLFCVGLCFLSSVSSSFLLLILMEHILPLLSKEVYMEIKYFCLKMFLLSHFSKSSILHSDGSCLVTAYSCFITIASSLISLRLLIIWWILFFCFIFNLVTSVINPDNKCIWVLLSTIYIWQILGKPEFENRPVTKVPSCFIWLLIDLGSH